MLCGARFVALGAGHWASFREGGVCRGVQKEGEERSGVYVVLYGVYGASVFRGCSGLFGCLVVTVPVQPAPSYRREFVSQPPFCDDASVESNLSN